VRSKFGATLTLVSQYQERLLEVRNARDVALAETIEAKKEAKDAFDRAEHAEESISALESKVRTCSFTYLHRNKPWHASSAYLQ